MSFFVNYTTKSGRSTFSFVFVQRPDGVRIYIAHGPDYPAGRGSLHTSHRLWCSQNNLHYICWTTPVLSMNEAQTIAASWSENTEALIERGTFGSTMFTEWAEDSVTSSRRSAWEVAR